MHEGYLLFSSLDVHQWGKEGTVHEEDAVDDIITELKPRLLHIMRMSETLWSHLRKRKVVNQEIREMLEASEIWRR
jgi:hypothetical protein